jgi:cytochrome c556
MAQDKKTYTIEIKTETDEATGEMKQLGSVIKTTAGEFDNINEAIGGTEDALGKLDPRKDAKEFKVLSKELQDLRDQQEKVELQSLRFSDALAETSGVTGILGQSLQGLRQTFIVLAANPLIAAFAALSAGALALVQSLKRTEEGSAKLAKIGEALSGIMDALFAIIEPIAFALADLAEELLTNQTFVDALAKAFAVLQGILLPIANFVSNQLTIAFKNFAGIAGGVGNILKGIFTFDIDTIKEGLTKVKDTVVTSFEATADNFKNTGKDIYKNLTEGLEEGEEQFRERITGVSRRLEAIMTDGFKAVPAATLKTTEEAGKVLEQSAKDNIQRVQDYSQEEVDTRSEFEKMALDQKLELTQVGLGAVANLINEDSKAGKALAVAQATIDTFKGANKALGQGGIFGIAAAAGIITAGFANVRKILSTDPPEVPVPSGAGASGGGGGRSSGFTPPSPPQLPTIEPPQIVGDTQGVDTGRAVQESIERGNQRPVRAYVVDQDVTTQQQATRRANNAANF